MTNETPPFGLTICGIDELDGHCDLRATHVLSILDPDYPVPEAFGRYGEHARLELRFNDVVDPTESEIVPTQTEVDRILAFGRSLRDEPDARLLVHCHAGVSRSTASMVLILAQALPDLPADRILAMVHGIREKAWPNLRLIELGDASLGRDGALVAATHALHSLQLQVRPHIGDYMRDAGRGREVDAAQRHAPLSAGP